MSEECVWMVLDVTNKLFLAKLGPDKEWGWSSHWDDYFKFPDCDSATAQITSMGGEKSENVYSVSKVPMIVVGRGGKAQ